MSKKKKKACKQGQEIQKILIQMLAELIVGTLLLIIEKHIKSGSRVGTVTPHPHYKKNLAQCQYAESIRLDPYRIGSCELCQTAGCIAS